MTESDDLSSLMNEHTSTAPTLGSEPASRRTSDDNPYLDDPAKGMELLAALLSANDRDDECAHRLAAIRRIIDHELLPHIDHDDNTAGPRLYAELLLWHEMLEEAVDFPRLDRGYTVAVGGSFSAGKTRFLNNVMGCPSLLPVDTTPTTSIPTYAFKSDEKHTRIEALSTFGKKTPIDENALKAVCHAFRQKYGITFSHLLRLIAVQIPSFNYSNLVFLDTPGYSKADTTATGNTDEHIARQYLRGADYLIWLVDQQNGTVPKADLDFIRSLGLQQPPLIVISKADKRIDSQLRAIIETARGDLGRAEIDCYSVIAYSAQSGEETSTDGNTLRRFLEQIDQPKAGSTLRWQLEVLFKRYADNYGSGREELSLTTQLMNELIFADGVSPDHRSNLENLRRRAKEKSTRLADQSHETQEILKRISDELTAIYRLLGISLASRPDPIQLQAMAQRKIEQDVAVSTALRLSALLSGDLKQLARFTELTALPGRVERISSVGLIVSVDQCPDLEIVITKSQLRLHAPHLSSDNISPYMPVTVQITGQNNCVVSLELE